jgi:excisionase family DNA binding protein
MTASNIPIPKVCEHCGKSFIARKATTRFCSHQCNSRRYKQHKREAVAIQATQVSVSILNTEMERIKARDFISIDQCSKLLGVSRFTIMRLVKSGVIASFKAGRRTILSRESINNKLNI